jgi:ABC-2 type transport system permease protein
VLGKFFAAATFFVIMLATTWIPMGILYIYGDPASGPILTAYLGLLLYGLTIIAIGMFISTLTENQIIAAVLSFGTIMVLWLVDVVAASAESTSKEILTYLSILSHLDDFMKGVLATSHIIFYLSLMLVGLFLTYRSVDSLRWRG